MAENSLTTLTDEERNLLAVMARHVGSDNAISSGSIAEEINSSDEHDTNPNVRALVKSVIEQVGVPIGANHVGYYIIHDEEDFEEYRGRLGKQVMGTLDRYELVRNAFHQ